jgi:hypothetical protein
MTPLLTDVELQSLAGIPQGPPREWALVWAIAGKLDPESHRMDIEARGMNLAHKHAFVERSLKPIYLFSLATADGGRAGQVSVWCPLTAAKMLAGIHSRGIPAHRLATKEEAEAWEAEQARQRSELKAAANSQHTAAEALAAALLAGR